MTKHKFHLFVSSYSSTTANGNQNCVSFICYKIASKVLLGPIKK